jgi:Family of unknown function (DUF6498)
MLRLVPLLGTLLVNAIPLVGVLVFNWSVFEVLFLYWFENVAIGVTHAIRMEISTRTNAVADGRSTTTFFMMHYGLFTFVHGVFVVALFGVVGDGFADIGPAFTGAVLAVVVWQIVFLIFDILRTERFKGSTPDAMMFEPYPRVLALHLTVLAGGWLVTELGTPVWALVVLVGVKTLFDTGVAVFFPTRTGNTGNVLAALRKKRG